MITTKQKAINKNANFEKIEKTNKIPFDVKEALDTGFSCMGTSQSGKTNLAKWLVQELLKHDITVFVIDASQAWLRETPIHKHIQIYGDEKEIEFDKSAVFDISALKARKKIHFVDQLCQFLYNSHVDGITRKHEFLVFEEAQVYMPQGSFRLSTRKKSMLESVVDIVTIGANFNLRFGVITQFPAMVDKSPVKICQQRYFGWTTEKNDMTYIKHFIGKEWAKKLTELERGEFIYNYRGQKELIKTERFSNSRNWFNSQSNFELFLSTETYI